MLRTIVHVDMDAFFASIEERDNPELKGKPVVVGGRGEGGEREVVSSASYSARAFGIKAAMPLVTAAKLCPNGYFVPANTAKYKLVCRQLIAVLSTFTPLVEPASVDEAFLDMTEGLHLFGQSSTLGQKIKQKIKEELDLPASVGIGPNKFLAKLASDHQKPDGLVIVKSHQVKDWLRNIPVAKLWGVGPKNLQILTSLGIETIGQLADLPIGLLCQRLSSSYGQKLYELARGIDNEEVTPYRFPQSISHQWTFPQDTNDKEIIKRTLLGLADQIASELRKKFLLGQTISLKVKLADFTALSRSHTLKESIALDQPIYEAGQSLFESLELNWQRIRLVGLSISNLSLSTGPRQLGLFEDKNEKLIKLSKAIDYLREKYGEKAIVRAGVMGQKEKP